MYNLNERVSKKYKISFNSILLHGTQNNSTPFQQSAPPAHKYKPNTKMRKIPTCSNKPQPAHSTTPENFTDRHFTEKKTQRQKMASTITDISQCFFLLSLRKDINFTIVYINIAFFATEFFTEKTIACPFHYSKIVRPLFRAFSAVFFFSGNLSCSSFFSFPYSPQ